ncbi:MAG: DUF4846 domain-containing protein [Flavobacteriales bacterium]
MRRTVLPLIALATAGCCSGQLARPIGVEAGSNEIAVELGDTAGTIGVRSRPPVGFSRTVLPAGSFAHYLRNLPLKPSGAPVHLYNGELKRNQRAHAAVVDLSVGRRDLQQCADALIRLRAEHLYASGRQDDIAFDFTSGFRAEWKRWRKGERIRVSGNACTWTHSEKPDASHDELLRYLDTVFTYAGSLSLQRELDRHTPADMSAGNLRGGDVFIQGGSPGHAMIVVDVAAHQDGRTAFLLAQSYMPAQEIHLVRNLRHPELGAWFILEGDDRLYTPEWTFAWSDRRQWP